MVERDGDRDPGREREREKKTGKYKVCQVVNAKGRKLMEKANAGESWEILFYRLIDLFFFLIIYLLHYF